MDITIVIMENKILFSGYKGWFLLIKMCFAKNKKQSFLMFAILLVLATSGVAIDYLSNLLSGKLTDSLVSKDYNKIIYFLTIVIIVHIIFACIYAIKDYVDRKLSILLKANLYYSIDPQVVDDTKCKFAFQRMTGEIECFVISFLRLLIYFIKCSLYFPIFIFVLYEIGGYKMMLFSIFYSIFGQICSKYLADKAYPFGYQLRNMNSDFIKKIMDEAKKPSTEKRYLPSMEQIIKSSIDYYKKERLLDLFRDIFSEMKSYLPYFILLTSYLNNSITLGDCVRCISAFRYVMQSLGFFTDNRMNLLQFSMSIHRINELINSKKS